MKLLGTACKFGFRYHLGVHCSVIGREDISSVFDRTFNGAGIEINPRGDSRLRVNETEPYSVIQPTLVWRESYKIRTTDHWSLN